MGARIKYQLPSQDVQVPRVQLILQAPGEQQIPADSIIRRQRVAYRAGSNEWNEWSSVRTWTSARAVRARLSAVLLQLEHPPIERAASLSSEDDSRYQLWASEVGSDSARVPSDRAIARSTQEHQPPPAVAAVDSEPASPARGFR